MFLRRCAFACFWLVLGLFVLNHPENAAPYDILFGEDNALATQLLARASGSAAPSSASMKSRSLP